MQCIELYGLVALRHTSSLQHTPHHTQLAVSFVTVANAGFQAIHSMSLCTMSTAAEKRVNIQQLVPEAKTYIPYF